MKHPPIPPVRNLLEAFQAYLLELQAGATPESPVKLPGELELAKRFKVSRSAVREVLMHFQYLGILERTKNKGTFIHRLSTEKLEGVVSFCFQVSGLGFEELKEARLHLESAILPMLVKRLTPEGVQRLERNIEDMKASAGKVDRAEDLDRDFHLTLFELSGNRALRVFAHIMHRLFLPEHRDRYRNSAAALRSAESHGALLQAIRAGDVAKAQEIIHQHISPT
jgi:GntR family galactonate operon transcriptional repressor